MGFGMVAKSVFNSVRLKKRVFDPKKLDIHDIILPKAIDSLDQDVIITMAKEELSTYKSLSYKDKTLGSLGIRSYHSFQIGILLRTIKINYDLFIPDKEKVFPTTILQNYSKENIQNKLFELVYRYDCQVGKGLLGQKLIDDIQWTPLDATYLLLYLSTYQY